MASGIGVRAGCRSVAESVNALGLGTDQKPGDAAAIDGQDAPNKSGAQQRIGIGETSSVPAIDAVLGTGPERALGITEEVADLVAGKALRQYKAMAGKSRSRATNASKVNGGRFTTTHS